MHEFELAKDGQGVSAPDFGLGPEMLALQSSAKPQAIETPNGMAEHKAQNNPAAKLLETRGIIPHVEVPQLLPADPRVTAIERVSATSNLAAIEVAQLEETPKEVVERLATADDRSTFKEFDAVARRARAPRLTDAQKLDYINLSPDMKEMFKNTLTELEKLASGKVQPSEYMVNTMKDAARIAEANGRAPDSWNYFKPSQAELFRDYVGMAFSDRPRGFWREAARNLAGSPHSSIGSALETTYQRLTEKPTAGDSFNPNILDNVVTNSVTHHFRELFVIGFNSGKYIGDTATTQRDDARTNPGDVRNGFFASMLGNALQRGKITPREAAELTEWAYTKHGGTPPPWGNTHHRTKWLGSSEYDIDKWMDAYRKRKP